MSVVPLAEEQPLQKAQLSDRLDKIRSQPKLQSQQQTAIVLKAVEDTLRDQGSEPTPTAYFAALLSILSQSLSASAGFSNKDVATAVVYLLDLFTPHVSPPLLKAKFAQILSALTPALSLSDVDAPFLRPAIGCLESLLVAQDGQAWSIPLSQDGPRKALSGLLNLSIDHRPKVRKRAQDAVSAVLQNGPPGPSAEHPAADMCAESSLRNLETLSDAHTKQLRQQHASQNHDPALIHVMQLIKTIAKAANGWPTRNLDSICNVLFSIARSRSEFLATTAFEVFEAVLEFMASDSTSEKLPRLVEAIMDLQPSQNDTQLLPPWIAVISRAHDVLSQTDPVETFTKLPSVFSRVASFLSSPSYNIRVSASECLVSFLVNCIPSSVLLEPSIYDEKTIEKIGTLILDLFDVKYQSAWMEVFNVVSAFFENLRWQADPAMQKAIVTIGDLRGSDSFQNKDKADEVLAKAIQYVGPKQVLALLPLNVAGGKPGQPGRAWLLPLIRDNVRNTNLGHFKAELVPLSEQLFEKVMAQSGKEKSMETKIYETLVQQIWSCLPGYCDRPMDLKESFDQDLAEMVAKLLYQRPEMRTDLCRALQNLVESFKTIVDFKGEEDLIAQDRISKARAHLDVEHLSTFSPNLLAVLFNVYGETLPQNRGPILSCINAYLSIAKASELSDTFEKVVAMLEQSIQTEQSAAAAEKKQKPKHNQPPPVSHALMDIVVTMAVYLPRESYQRLFSIATTIISQQAEPQLQKKAYKLIPRLAQCEVGQAALIERSSELQQLLLGNEESTTAPARRDRLNALLATVKALPAADLYFIPSIVPEVILRTKETNERTRETSYSLIIEMGEKMKAGGTIDNSRIGNANADAPSVPASLDEYFSILSAGLAGTTPHMISASVTAISRALFEFHKSLTMASLAELLDTMDLFLQSPTREVVRSVLGLVKVCIVALPHSFMEARLPSLIPHLINWSHEHKGDFRTKVRNILDRIMRHYGIEMLEQNCPADDKKLITNIRKTRERKKKQKKGDGVTEQDGGGEEPAPRRAKFENEFDEAVYGSEDSDLGSEDDGETERVSRKPADARKGRRGRDAFIHEDEDEPLDLLDKRVFANISSTKPGKAARTPKRSNAKTDLDGKLVLGNEGDDDDADMMDFDDGGNAQGKGVDAYVEAIRGKHAARRGQRGKLKFSNKPSRGGEEFDEGEESGASGRGEMKKPRRDGRGGKQAFRGGAGRAQAGRGGRVGKRGFKPRR